MTNKAVASVLKETAALIDLTGGNPFRSRAMSNAARTIDRLEESVESLLKAGALTDVRGIGAGLAGQIAQLIATGSFDVRDDLLGAIPPGLLDMLAVKGLGAKKVRSLWKTLGIQTLDELEVAAGTGQISHLEGFGSKSESSILENVAALRIYRKQRHYADAFLLVDEFVNELRSQPQVVQVEAAGELRRRMEVVSDVELVIELVDGESITFLEALFGPVLKTDQQTVLNAVTNSDIPTFSSALPDGLPLTIRIAPPGAFGSLLFARTGSESFLQAWHRLFPDSAPQCDEGSVFDAAGVTFIPPELREQESIIELAKENKIPRLIDNSDLRGSLHNHSTYSDGAHTLREMAEAARGMGLSYFGICDHSQSLRIAHGLSPEEVHRQQEEIAALNEEYAADGQPPFRIFSGIESDILADGSLDYEDDVLATFDMVVASVHTGFNMSEAEATARVIRAVSNPFTTILGHPTGRLLLRRNGYPLDHDAVLDACAEHNVSVELNANPYRLDLDWRWIHAATERGILISINPDAHATEQLAYTHWGVAVARKSYLTADMCLNALSLDAITEWLQTRSSGHTK